MNPKLDTGMAIESAKDRGKIFKNALNVQELIGIVDAFITSLVSRF